MTKDEVKKLVKDLRSPPLEHAGTAAPKLGYAAEEIMRKAANLIEELIKEIEAVGE